ncbi:16066_t:CDS:2 [Rhizophagus irregularis]|nr:16066_t:CDS:2 [Rhizophagus irregularis]
MRLDCNTESEISLGKENRRRMDLISSVQQLSDKEISAVNPDFGNKPNTPKRRGDV